MKSYSFNQEFDKLVKVTLATTTDNNTTANNNKNKNKEDMIDRSAKNPNFFQDKKSSVKKFERKYTTTHIKSRNFLSNISYIGINKEDLHNENFIFDIYLLMTKNLNPFSLDRKLNDPNKHEMIYMIWKDCMPSIFYKYICQEENFFNMFNQMCTPKYTVQPKEQASTSKGHLTLYSKPTRAKKIEHLGKKSPKSQKLPCRNMCF